MSQQRNIHIRQHTSLVYYGRSVMRHAQQLNRKQYYGRGILSYLRVLSLSDCAIEFSAWVASFVKGLRSSVIHRHVPKCFCNSTNMHQTTRATQKQGTHRWLPLALDASQNNFLLTTYGRSCPSLQTPPSRHP